MPHQKYCDPSICEHCIYLCEGDFICTKYNHALVKEDWNNTSNWCMCRTDPTHLAMKKKTKQIIAISIFAAFLLMYAIVVTLFQEVSREVHQIITSQEQPHEFKELTQSRPAF